MKRIVLFFVFALVANLFAQKSFAQGNLQFNQVLTGTVVLPSGITSSSITVPTGKVWKIESVLSQATGTAGGVVGGYFQINGANFAMNSSVSMYSKSIWLKASDVFSMYNPTASTFSYFYSIIEYNIIP